MLDYLDGEGCELRTILLDDQRAPLVRQAFTLYATGEWTIGRLTKHLNNQGLTTPPGPRTPSKPLIKGHVQRLLTNPYYTGKAKFQGTLHPGRHEALVDDATWQTVQTVLAAHLQGERTRRHPPLPTIC